ncbi:MAG: HlyD family efflux transporter periplasmic adaptor subunit [Thermoanaerobaculia bacterium]
MNANRKTLARRLLKWGVPIAVILLLLVLALRPEAVAVDLAQAERGSLRVTVEDEGQTRVTERFVVSAPVAGRLLRIELEPGDPVTAGETILALFRPSPLDPRSRAEAVASVRSAEAALGAARAAQERADSELSFARLELERLQRLASQDIVAQERVDEAQTALEARQEAARAAAFSAAAAEGDLERSRAALLAADGSATAPSTLELRSPVDGVVLVRQRESEAVVTAGEPLLEVGDPASLEIVADLLSSDAVRVRAGQRVLVDQWGGETPLAGRVRRVEPYGFTKISALGVEEQRVNVIVELTDPREEWSALGDGYRVEIAVVLWEGEDLLTIPMSSAFRHGDGWAVWQVVDGRAKLAPVELGRRNGVDAEVRSGLTEGDTVIQHPGESVDQDVRVEAREPRS